MSNLYRKAVDFSIGSREFKHRFRELFRKPDDVQYTKATNSAIHKRDVNSPKATISAIDCGKNGWILPNPDPSIPDFKAASEDCDDPESESEDHGVLRLIPTRPLFPLAKDKQQPSDLEYDLHGAKLHLGVGTQ